MHKDKAKYSDSHLFTFTNSIKTSQKATPETSNNVSFQNGITASMKSFYTQPYSLLKESHFPHLFHHNKQNQYCKRDNRSNSKNEKWKYMTNPQPDHCFSKKTLNRERNGSKTNIAFRQRQRNISPLNIKIDLTSSISNSQQNKLCKNTLSSKKQKAPIKDEHIKVFIRFKPKTQKQTGKQILSLLNQNTIKIQENYFCFDEVFSQDANQEDIFKEVGLNMCNKLFEGYNGTIFAYGQTGSGKTYTIFGQQSLQNYGLIYRCIRQILQSNQNRNVSAKVKCSMVQLYKQQLIDMFGSGVDLKLKQNKNGQVYIEGLRDVYIKNEAQMMHLVRNAAKGRKVTATKLNEQSSRSHTILTIYLQYEKYTTKLCLIDLAGSQKVCKSGTKGQAFQETKKINYSLSCLGNVINALTTRGKADHIPFRDSKLTRILKDSLTGNFITSIIVNCSLSDQSVNETISSLKFAQRAKKIKINVQSLEEQILEKQSIHHLQTVIKKLQHDLQLTTNQLKKYKENQKSLKKENLYYQRQSSLKKVKINFPSSKSNSQSKKNEQIQQNNVSESQITSRCPIPSERALVQQHIKKYKNQIGPNKPISHYNNIFNFHDFSSLNVSKSVKKFGDNSPDISSLEFKYDQSPDLSLSFSIQGQTIHKQLFLNSPM